MLKIIGIKTLREISWESHIETRNFSGEILDKKEGNASVKTPAKGTSMYSNTYLTFHAVTAGNVGNRHTPPESHFMQCLHRR